MRDFTSNSVALIKLAKNEALQPALFDERGLAEVAADASFECAVNCDAKPARCSPEAALLQRRALELVWVLPVDFTRYTPFLYYLSTS